MKYFKYLLIVAVAAMTMTSCSSDDPDSQSIFPTGSGVENEFDQWIRKNYSEPYNIKVLYRYVDYETDNTYNVIPADVDKVKALAIIMKHIWLDAYTEVLGPDFLRLYSPRIFQFLGSGEYNSNGSVVLGTAEGGLKITLFRVNAMDLDNILIDDVSPFPNTGATPLDLNYWFFHTMHHEFCHILTQHKNYSTDFQLVSSSKYRAGDWINVKDEEAPLQGFVSGYASGEYNEDFAEIYSTYVTHTDAAWEQILKAGEKGDDKSGREAIETKLGIMKNYFLTSWGFDLDDLRDVVLRRTHEVENLDLRTLN